MHWPNKLSMFQNIGILIMAVGPWGLIYRNLFFGAGYNELMIGSLAFLLGGSFLWFMGWDAGE